MRKAARTDANQTKIVDALRDLGAVVNITSSLGDGFPDLVVSFLNRWFLIEIKDGDRPPSEKKLTPDEAEFHYKQRAPVFIVYTARDALLIVNNKAVRENEVLEWRIRQSEYISHGLIT